MRLPISGSRTATKSAAVSAGRWVAVFAGAAAGAYLGRVAAAKLYHEPAPPLTELGPRALLAQDVAPGFLAAELIGRGLGLGLAGEAVVAAVAAGLSVVATGPLVITQSEETAGPRIIPVTVTGGSGRRTAG